MNGTYILEAGMNISWHNQSYLIRALEPDFIVLENNKGAKDDAKAEGIIC